MLLQIIDFLIGIILGDLIGIISVVKVKQDLYIAIYEMGKQAGKKDMEERERSGE